MVEVTHSQSRGSSAIHQADLDRCSTSNTVSRCIDDPFHSRNSACDWCSFQHSSIYRSFDTDHRQWIYAGDNSGVPTQFSMLSLHPHHFAILIWLCPMKIYCIRYHFMLNSSSMYPTCRWELSTTLTGDRMLTASPRGQLFDITTRASAICRHWARDQFSTDAHLGITIPETSSGHWSDSVHSADLSSDPQARLAVSSTESRRHAEIGYSQHAGDIFQLSWNLFSNSAHPSIDCRSHEHSTHPINYQI